MNSLQQQARFDDFVHEFNTERPHEALAMRRPAEVYTPSQRPYAGLPDLAYPFHDRDILVTACGRSRRLGPKDQQPATRTPTLGRVEASRHRCTR